LPDVKEGAEGTPPFRRTRRDSRESTGTIREGETGMSDEEKTRIALSWAIQETVIRLPTSLRSADAWLWDEEDNSLYKKFDNGATFRFHVAGRMQRSGRVRIAVMTVEDPHGTVTWEADMPSEQAA